MFSAILLTDNQKEEHDWHLENLRRHPDLIGLEKVVFSAVEPDLFDEHHRQIGAPDLLFMLRDYPGRIYVVEYKNGQGTKKMRQQLRVARHFFEGKDFDVETLGVNYSGGKYIILARN